MLYNHGTHEWRFYNWDKWITTNYYLLYGIRIGLWPPGHLDCDVFLLCFSFLSFLLSSLCFGLREKHYTVLTDLCYMSFTSLMQTRINVSSEFLPPLVLLGLRCPMDMDHKGQETFQAVDSFQDLCTQGASSSLALLKQEALISRRSWKSILFIS